MSSDNSMDLLMKFETETYPRLWHLAYDAGVDARKKGLPRNCNSEVLKVYISAWEQGWDGLTIIPAVFGRMEDAVNKMPLRPCNADDFYER